MINKARAYFELFNKLDFEVSPAGISNEDAADFMLSRIPLIDCPDEDIMMTYYFRWWTFRKHIKMTEEGYVITEFLPKVSWSGPYNTINCPACFHIREGRWMHDGEIIKNYIRFWLDGKGQAFAYSSWYAHAVLEYCELKNDYAFAVECLPKLVAFFEERAKKHRFSCGLYWSNDDRDGMEFSISGPGLRPTACSYAYGDAVAIAEIARLAGDERLSEKYRDIADEIKRGIDRILWDGEFYKTVPCGRDDDLSCSERPYVEGEHNVRELVGYIPWYFGVPSPEKSAAFAHLLTESGFKAEYGLTTAEQSHPRFMEEHDHECLWNGPVWPFATSQVLVAASNLLHTTEQDVITKDDYCAMLLQYAKSHRLTRDDGVTVPWIDENMHPYTGRWLARDLLIPKNGYGIYERGKDYNHSLFCDLVLSGLFGISVVDGCFTAEPLVPGTWERFSVENLWLDGKRYRVVYSCGRAEVSEY